MIEKTVKTFYLGDSLIVLFRKISSTISINQWKTHQQTSSGEKNENISAITRDNIF